MVWYMVCYGMVWCIYGMVWYGMVWYGGMVWYDMVWEKGGIESSREIASVHT